MSGVTNEYTDKILHESAKSRIYLRSYSDGNREVVKVLNINLPTPEEISQFYNEFEILKDEEILGVRRVLRKGKDQNKHAIFLEYLEGQDIRTYFQQENKTLIDFLRIISSLCSILDNVHKKNILHLDLNAMNILVERHSQFIYLLDFGLASRINTNQDFIGNPNQLRGHINYISPEQTGRMNRSIDHRSDLYSLGVCLYEILTGNLPFQGNDAMEIVHAQIAHIPLPPADVDPEIPLVISNIVMKLLQKNAENRYQTSAGLKADIDAALNMLLNSGRIEQFELGKQDFGRSFTLPQKLYGRDREIHTLIEAFKNCVSGHKHLVLVYGYSGTGKSALVRELHKPVTESNAYFISGKYDQFQRAVPYFAILESFRQLIGMLLTEDDEKLSKISKIIQEAVGEEGRVLTRVLPDLVHIIGEQPELPEIGASEGQVRFNYVFSKFIRALSTPQTPIVMFLDDLQWADSASLKFLEAFMSQTGEESFMCVGAYRDNEVDLSHPLTSTIREISDSGTDVIHIEIGNLSEIHIRELLADATLHEQKTVIPLADIIYKKTAGNAFYTLKFILYTASENMLYFNTMDKKWAWNTERILKEAVTENVVDFMTRKLKLLPEKTLEILKTAAGIGNQFDTGALATIHQISEDELKSLLFPALQEHLILTISFQKYKFSHDRIQQAVYSLLDTEAKERLHYKIGKLLLANSTEHELEARLFDITNQLNQGLSQISSPAEKMELAGFNLRAGKKSKENSAFQSSFAYLRNGQNLLPEGIWSQDYPFALELYTEASEAAYLCGDFDKMNDFFTEVNTHSKNVLDKVKAVEIRILGFKAQNRLIEAIYSGLDLLEELGEPLPRKPNEIHIFSGLAATMWRLRGKSMDDLLNKPEMTDPYKIAAMRIIADITSSVYWAMPKLTPLVVFKMINISLKHGNNAVSCFAYGSYGVILCGVLGMMKKGNEFGHLSLRLLDKLDAKEWKAQIYVSPYALTFHWRNHVDVTLKPLRESFHIGLETGLIEFACINTNIYCIHCFLSGKTLSQTEKETHAYSESYRQMKQQTNLYYNEVYRQAMLNFMDLSEDPVRLTGDAYDEDLMRKQNTEREDKTGMFFIHFLSGMLKYYFGQHEAAIQEIDAAKKLLDAVLAKFEIPNLYFYEALTLLSMISDSGKPISGWQRRTASARNKLHKWAKDAPDNFQHKYDLVQAEYHRVKGRNTKALHHYEKAIDGAAKNGFLHEEALSRELTAKFFLSINLNGLAEYYMRSAYSVYREWGAIAKLKLLEEEFPNLLSKGWTESRAYESGSTSQSLSGKNLDIATVIKSATTISGEVVLSRLLRALIHLALENAGAQRALLLLENDNELIIQAEKNVLNQTEEVLQSKPVNSESDLPLSVLKFVQRTKEKLILDDAVISNQFQSDPFIQLGQIHSIMCLPIIHHGKLTGILYLENKTTIGSFTKDRVELLSLLSAQIAISIENAMLYENLESKVKERTQELSREKQKSDELLYNILPYETAQELKLNGFAQPRNYEKVSVLFTDFVNFTKLSEGLDPGELVVELDTQFKAFDAIIEKYGLEKIKTIGDAYLAVCGVPIPNPLHAVNTVKAALEIRDFVAQRRTNQQGAGFEVRIGINSGPVVAGIVGQKKFQFDIWGDTVNIASRMESSGEAGKINISRATYEDIKDAFDCEFRGKIVAKGKGELEMYFVENKTENQ